MQIPVGRLRQALKTLAPIVPRKTTLPACQHVLLGEGRALANNLEVAAALQLPDADGETLCPQHARLLEFLEYVPGEAIATIQRNNTGMTIEVAGNKATVPIILAEDFPPFPVLSAQHEAVADGDALVKALEAVRPYTATDQARPALTAVCLTLGEKPEAAGADGFRLAWEPLPPFHGGPSEGRLLVPGEAVDILGHLWKQGRRPDLAGARTPADLAMAKRLVRLAWTQTRLKLVFGDVEMLTILTEGQYPNYPLLIPKEFATHVTFMADDVLRGLRSMSPVARDSSGIIRLEWGDGHLTLSAHGEGTGTSQSTLPATCEGEGQIAFNLSYLLNYLKGKQGMVKMAVGTPSAPALFTYQGRTNYMVMPMFVQPAGKKPTEVTAEASAETPAPVADTQVDNMPQTPEPEAPSAVVDTPVDIPAAAEVPPVEKPVKPKRGRKAKAATV